MSKAIFIDRDGCINKLDGYVNNVEDFHILPRAADAIKVLKQAGFKIFVVTNQGGVEKGFINEDDLQQIHYKMKLAIPEIDDIAYCPDYDSFERKPNPGMIYSLAYEYEVFTNGSWFIGDNVTDAMAGKRAGCSTILVESSIMHSIKHADDLHVDYVADDIFDAAIKILEIEGLI